MRYDIIKKLKIFLVLLLLLVSITAVSAADELNETAKGDNAIQDIIEDSNSDSQDILAVDESESKLEASQFTVHESDYGTYFDLKGNLVSDNVKAGDTVNLAGSFTGKKFIFDRKVNIVGISSNKMSNSMITILSGASGSTVSNLNIENTNKETYGIFLNSASNCIIQGCTIKNTGQSSYCICVANGANYNKILNNNLKAYGVTYGHGSFSRSTPPMLLSGSHYNEVSHNHVEADDANGIYLSSYSGGPIKGGNSNFNTIYDNYVHYNVLPTSWAYGIQVMGNNNIVNLNTVVGGYRGVSTAGSGNVITGNKIINLTGADYTHPGVETGGEYGIVASYNSIVTDNQIIDAKIISTGAGISAIDNSVVEHNFVNATSKGRGIVAGGSNVVVKNNIVFTESGSGIYQKDEGHGLIVENNNVTSKSGVGILIEKLSNKRMPSHVTVRFNDVITGNKYAIDATGVQADTSIIEDNIAHGKLVGTPSGVIDTSKPTYIYKGTVLNITSENIRTYIDANGGLTSEVKDGDILNFKGVFNNEVIYITKGVKITGENPIFYDSTFKITCGNVFVENLKIINEEVERVNAWGIFVNEASGVRISNNNIKVSDPKAAYAIYVLASTGVEVIDNTLESEGDFLTFTLLCYESEDCTFTNNRITTIGTGEAYKFSPEKCIDGNELVIDGKAYCIDGNELVIDGKSYCIDGEELVIDGRAYSINNNVLIIDGVSYPIGNTETVINGSTYCIDGNELVIDGRSYCIDGNELVIDGKSYCIDGEELVINGTSYGTEYSTGNAHVVSEIYQTYGILLLYSSNNVVSDNNVNVTSKLNESYSTIGNESSQNSLVGIDLYYNSHNNTFLKNTVYIKGNDNYIYGMGVLGYYTGHNAPLGQGASDNKFIGNKITLDGSYCAEGIIIGDESENTLVDNNTIVIKSGVSYGIYFEMSQQSTVTNNILNQNSQVIYGILGYDSSNNIVSKNELNAKGNFAYGILFSNGNHNQITLNKIHTNSTGEPITITNLDSIGYGNAGISLKANSTYNNVLSNEITAVLGYAVSCDDEAIDNIIDDNYLDCEVGYANNAVNSSDKNTVSNNYKFIANAPKINVGTIKYLGDGQFNVTFGDEFNGGYVKFFDGDNQLIGQSDIVNGTSSFTYSFDYSYGAATYAFNVQLFKENYKASVFPIQFTIDKADYVVVFDSFSMIQGDTQQVQLKILDPLGNPVNDVTVKFNMVRGRDIVMGTAKTGNDGIAKVVYELPASVDLADYKVRADLSGLSNYDDISVFTNMTVLPRLDVFIDIYSNVYTKSPVAILKDSNGDIMANKKASIKIGTVTYSVTTNANGEVVLPGNVKGGSYTVFVTSPAQGKYNENTSSALSVLIVNPMTGGKDYSVYYGNTIKYKVRIFDTNGKAIGAGKTVIFKVNGKTKYVKTDGSGYATYSVKLGVGKYTITANYGSFSISNKITVKSTLTAKNIVKKKAKKIKFSVKVVNKNGKAVKKKKITFKIKGKKYSAKTNKKGVATLTIKNLKVGKYTITSSYAGCAIKNTIKIKK